MKEHPNDKHLAMVGADLGHHIHDNAIRSALHAASVLTTQSDYKNAMDWARKVLAIEPDNADAKKMVSTIQNAEAESSNEWRYGWRITNNNPRRQSRRRGGRNESEDENDHASHAPGECVVALYRFRVLHADLRAGHLRAGYIRAGP